MATKKSDNKKKFEPFLLVFAVGCFLLVAADFASNIAKTLEARAQRVAVTTVNPNASIEPVEELSQEELNRLIKERFKGEIQGR